MITRMNGQIVWDAMTATVTTATFKRIKGYVLGLKEDAARRQVLTDPAGLRERLQATDVDWEFSDAEMMTAVGHLANYGYVRVLRTASGSRVSCWHRPAEQPGGVVRARGPPQPQGARGWTRAAS